MKTKHHHLSSLLLCLLGLIPGMAFTEADGAPNRSPELRKVDETHTKQFNDLLAAIHVYDPSKEQVEARLRKIGITWGHGCELSLLSLPEKHRKGHGDELRAIAKMLGLTPEEQAAAKKPRGNEPQRPATGAPDSDIAKLHARIDKNPLPKGYQGNRHQPYVDRVMAGLKPEQRARVGQLWKEKRRLDSDMPNPGASFVRILTHVAEEAGKSKHPTYPVTNLTYKFYHGAWNKMPDFSKIKPKKEGKLPAGRFDVSPRDRDDGFGFVFTGDFHCPVDGEYVFATISDDGSQLLIDGKMVVDNDGLHAEQTREGKITLKAGKRRLEVRFFENNGGKSLKVTWKIPHGSEAVAGKANPLSEPTNAPFTNKPVTPLSTTTQPKKPPASTNDHGTSCVCKDCRKKKKGGSLFPDVENRP